MSSFLYYGYNMDNLSQYTIDCKDCPKKVKVFKAAVNSYPAAAPKNIGRYYYSCKNTNINCKCNYFRWFEHKWPKVQDQYQTTELNSIPGSIDNDMSVLIGQIQYLKLEELSEQDKIEMKDLVVQLEKKIKNSDISQSGKTAYFNTLSELKKIL